MNPEEQDPVWKLLESSRPVRVDPMFSRNVARMARLSSEDAGAHRSGWLGRLHRALTTHRTAAWSFSAAAVAALLVVWGAPRITSEPAAAHGEGIASRGHSPAPSDIPADSEPSQNQLVESVFTEIDSLEEELDQLDRLDQLIAAQDVQAIDDELIADILF